MGAALVLPPPGTGSNEVTLKLRNHTVTGTYYVYTNQTNVFEYMHVRLPLGAMPYFQETKTEDGVHLERHTAWDPNPEVKSASIAVAALGRPSHKLALKSAWLSPRISDTDDGVAFNMLYYGSLEKDFGIDDYGNPIDSDGVISRSLSAGLFATRGAGDSDYYYEVPYDELPWAPSGSEDYEEETFVPLPRPVTGIVNAEITLTRYMTEWEEMA